jgi:hypothetical protein
MPAQVDRFEHENLHIEIERTGSSVHLVWGGVSDARDPASFLLPLMNRLVAESKGKSVTLDFSTFEYMNSATVTPILNFVKALDSNGIPSTLVYDSTIDWQRINFQCMKTIARTMKHVRVEARPAAAGGRKSVQ